MYQKIIVPVDCSEIEKGENALKQARHLLSAGGEIVLISVIENLPSYLALDLPPEVSENMIKDAENRLQELQGRTAIAVIKEIRVGAAAHEILQAAAHHKADLIIVASHIPDFSNYLLGATADRVVRHARCSVLVMR